MIMSPFTFYRLKMIMSPSIESLSKLIAINDRVKNSKGVKEQTKNKSEQEKYWVVDKTYLVIDLISLISF